MRGAVRYFVIMVVDVVGFGRRPNPTQVWLRKQLYELVEQAIVESGLDFGTLSAEDRGDGAIWLIPGSTPKTELSGRFIDRLHDALMEHARRANPESELRLRVAFHAGEIARDERGWAGADLNTACRLVDLAALKDALAAAPGSVLGVAVSEAWYSGVIRHGYAEVRPEAYRRVEFRAKEVESTAWIRIPGGEVAAGVGGEAGSLLAGDGVASGGGAGSGSDAAVFDAAASDVPAASHAAPSGEAASDADADADAGEGGPKTTMNATVSGNGTVYMSGRDMHIATGGRRPD